MALVSSVVSWLMKKRMHQIELFIKYPHDVQSEWFKRLLQDAKDTEWGKKYGYQDIKSVKEFRERVPVSDYDALKPYIERIRKGEQKILWGTDIKWFAKSSGTTSDKSKFIPLSQESLEECHYKGGKDLLSIYCNNFPDTEIFDGKGLAMGGSHQICEVNNDVFYGDLSAILMQNLPYWAEFMRTPGLSIALMDEWEEKIEKMAEVTSRHHVTSLSGVPSWVLLLLHRILEKTGEKDIKEVWPSLEVFFHGGVRFEPYRGQYRDIISGPFNYVETYNASEGFFGIQDRLNAKDMLLMLDYGIFYEFIPAESIDDASPPCLSLDEVETEKNYALIISTNGGLWRYLIGDTIKFTSLNPYRIRITGRTKNFINAVGEEIIIDNAENALASACKKTGAVVSEYTAGPVHPQGGSVYHRWLIEFETPPENPAFFSETFDTALKSLNSDYEAKRYRNMILDPPEIIPMPKGTFYNWLKSRGKLGGQHKVPRLSNDLKIIGEILEQQR